MAIGNPGGHFSSFPLLPIILSSPRHARSGICYKKDKTFKKEKKYVKEKAKLTSKD